MFPQGPGNFLPAGRMMVPCPTFINLPPPPSAGSPLAGWLPVGRDDAPRRSAGRCPPGRTGGSPPGSGRRSPAQRRPAQGGVLHRMPRAAESVRGRASGNQLPDEHGDHQPGTLAAAVVGSERSWPVRVSITSPVCNGWAPAAPGQNHRQPVLLDAGKAAPTDRGR